ncbi:hypothetical protein [Parageobacillus thermoglucosidasius]|uniref:hypothetical protein n=1 Tax=Parageobacillus thermoglucosidasius TaxID=1426 RepID=UPI00242E56DC|nr:hypothetical protein [Parageobacillus thermoglucosidasius]
MEEELRKKPTTVIDSDGDTPSVVREKTTKKLSANELHRMFFNGRTKIETQQDLDAALEQLRTNLLRELKDHILEIE